MAFVDVSSGETTCPVCGIDKGRPVFAQAVDPITSDMFRILQCPACGVSYTAPRPATLDRYYPRRYRGYGPLVTRVLKSFYDLRVGRWSRLRPQGGSMLEVGCGLGLMLAAFRRQGWRVLGIERNEATAETVRRTQNVDVVTTPVEELPADARFDLIVMFHVLEHIAQPIDLLRECASRLAPDGLLITNVPNFASWQARFAGPRWLHLDPPRHLIHFTPVTLAATLERAGLKLMAISYASPEHDPYGWVESALNRITGRSNTLTRFLMGLDPFTPSVLISLLLGALLTLPALLLAALSWPARRGALIEVIAQRADSTQRN